MPVTLQQFLARRWEPRWMWGGRRELTVAPHRYRPALAASGDPNGNMYLAGADALFAPPHDVTSVAAEDTAAWIAYADLAFAADPALDAVRAGVWRRGRDSDEWDDAIAAVATRVLALLDKSRTLLLAALEHDVGFTDTRQQVTTWRRQGVTIWEVDPAAVGSAAPAPHLISAAADGYAVAEDAVRAPILSPGDLPTDRSFGSLELPTLGVGLDMTPRPLVLVGTVYR